MFKKPISSNVLILGSALVLTLGYNTAFFGNVLKAYPVSYPNVLFVSSLGLVLFALIVFLLGLVGNRFTLKPALMLLFPCAALASYFMNTYNITIDRTIVQSVMKTDVRETTDLFSPRQIAYFLFLGVVPAAIIFLLPIKRASFTRELVARGALVAGSLVLVAGLAGLSSDYYASFAREHKILRYYTNPLTFIYSTAVYFKGQNIALDPADREPVGVDAVIPATDKERELVVLVVGETLRSDHLSLNGYTRPTTPELAKRDVVSFVDMESCATSTALSLPCLFAPDERRSFDVDESLTRENLLDVLAHAGVSVLWRDNNSDSKGVAVGEGISFEDFRSHSVNPVCDIECRDVGMLEGLDEYIAGEDAQDILIVLHQMGNHGPAYHKRYPKSFERFTPVCKTNQLEQCSSEEINNAYDNAVAYTDYFLSSVIDFLKQFDDEFQTAMFYISDHGESLGEDGLYLHGMPMLIAPHEQTQVASVMWFGDQYEVDSETMEELSVSSYTHDNVFHTVLGLMEIESSVYQPELDIIRPAKIAGSPIAGASAR